MTALSLVIPCYNEARNLPLLVRRLDQIVTRDDVEIVLVDNGSADETPELLDRYRSDRAFLETVRVEVNRGYGHGILRGLEAARGKVLAWTHADLQTDPGDAMTGLTMFDESATEPIFVKGRRYARPAADVVFTVGMAAFETVLLGRRMWDINAQPTMFTRAFFESWKQPPDDFSLDLYAYYQAKRQNLVIKRFPVRFGERAHGSSHWNVDWRAKFRFIRRTMSYSLELRKRLQVAQ